LFGVHAQLDDLERDPSLDRLRLFGHINHATTAFPDLLEQFVPANSITRPLANRGVNAQSLSGHRGSRLLKEVAAGVGIEQELHAPPQGGIVSASLVEAGGAFFWRQGDCSSKNGFFANWLFHGLGYSAFTVQSEICEGKGSA